MSIDPHRPRPTSGSRHPVFRKPVFPPRNKPAGYESETEVEADAEPSNDAPAAGQPKNARPAFRRRRPISRGGAFDDGTQRILIRVGVAAAIAIIGVIVGIARSKPAGDQRYFDALVAMDRSLDRGIGSVGTLRQKVNALPIDGVTDPKLREIHQVMLEIVDAAEKDDLVRIQSVSLRYDRLVQELNAKYAR